ncbi:MAG: sdaAA [Eubacterium sp.]|jgi:L-serine dehydratase|nr:sdaAA [Eubacterium sp.]
MLKYESLKELLELALQYDKTISDIVLEDQMLRSGKTAKDLINEMAYIFDVMCESVTKGINSSLKSDSGLVGGDAVKLKKAIQEGKTLAGKVMDSAILRAVAVAEVNACMGRIVAAPTAGSCGIIPAALVTVMEEKNLSKEKVVMALFTSAGIGQVISCRASLSGAEGGCQAECGSASAMAAAALVEIAGGTPQMAANACAISLKNVLGLVCDPVAGLVEVPCVKRNAAGVANAFVAADMALAGIESVIPADEVIDAMKSIGDLMPVCLKETAEGGLASTPTGASIAKRIFGVCK